MYGNIVILSGAGISAESGIPTFRDCNGLWNNHKVEDVATIQAYYQNPKVIHNFYNQLRKDIEDKKPNPAHFAITRLQHEYKNGTVSVITQNVDLLHEKAGNVNVVHIHGQIDQSVCMNCGKIITSLEDTSVETVCPFCHIQGKMKPNIVFFGENLLSLNQVQKLLSECRLFIAIGTSGAVYPANTFASNAKYYGADTIEFNLHETINHYDFDNHIVGPAGQMFPPYVEKILKQI